MKNAQDTFAMLDRASDKLATYRKAVALLRPSEPVVQTVGKIPEADIVLLDEIFKCNDGVLNSLLTALNERKYTNEGHTYPIPTISFFAASNEIPNFNDPQEKILEALYDRLELKVVTANIEDRDTRLAVLKNKQSGAFGQVSTTITLEELIEMQREVAEIPVPDSANELADDILCELRKSMAVSDRKYLGYYPIAQARAWLSGHDKVESSVESHHLSAQLDERLADEICPAAISAGLFKSCLRIQCHLTNAVDLFLHGVDAKSLEHTLHLFPVSRQMPEIVLQRQQVGRLHLVDHNHAGRTH